MENEAGENTLRSETPTIFWIASTGGHLRQLLGLSELFARYNSFLFTEKTESTKVLKQDWGKRLKFFAFGSKVHFVSYIFKFAFNSLKSLALFLRFRPDFIITTGTHTAVPMCFIAHTFGKKVVYIETRSSFSKITQSGRIVGKFSNLFVVQRKSLLKLAGFAPNAVLCEVEE